eukprot:gnl/MRDRNA2_/MRDRNA2_101512_c0_seq1.p1 gnl/MRDRNA2_/MRDRNA2_101512_c0~~gnl/MRDRNA2_/MRDRNA2_101512_c0_seq1.p1  ORF type:complete len:492 (+),score=130.76 gnl/MRDRNA2_/MRDRNA2_101512_c0_seq1:148-1623(+)
MISAVQAFLKEWELDNTPAAMALMREDELVQQTVLSLGGLAGVRSKTHCILGRIKKAKAQVNLPDARQVHPQLEMFIAENDIDEHAAQELRMEDMHIQQVIIDAGPLMGAKNKSSALIGRIKKAKHGGGLVLPGLEKYIKENQIDELAAQELRMEDLQIQQMILDTGPLLGARNTSSALMWRIKKAKEDRENNKGEDMNATAGMVQAQMLALAAQQQAQQEAIAQHQAQLQAQREAEEMEAIRQAQQKEEEGKRAQVQAWEFIKNRTRANQQHAQQQAYEAEAALAAQQAPPWEQHQADPAAWCQHQQALEEAEQATPGMDSAVKAIEQSRSLQVAVGNFIMQNKIDKKAAEQLRAESLEIQEAVIKMGSLENTKNPSGVVMGRLGRAKKNAGYGPALGSSHGTAYGKVMNLQANLGAGANSDINQFIAENQLDARVANALLCETREVQQKVMAEGSLKLATNPSRSAMVRIANAKRPGGPRFESGRPNPY